MNVLKALPGETYGVKLALTLRILGAALVKLPCLELLSAQKMKAEGFLSPAVAQPLVLVGKRPKQKTQLGRVGAHMKGLAKHGCIGSAFGRQRSEQSDLSGSAQGIKELGPIARRPLGPKGFGNH
jgi:hypothetical protein